MNPPTKGHELVMRKTIETGGENAFIFLSNSVDPSENPIDPKTKAQFISEIYPEFASHIVTDYVQGPIYAANWLYQKGFRNMAFVAGSDRLGKEKGSIEKLLNGWNSGPVRSTDPAGAREHVVMQYVSSGDRDPDAEGVTGYSGSKARAAAAAGNEQQFQQFTGVGPDVVINGKTLYQATRDGMGIKDQQPQQTAPVKKQPAPSAPSQQVIGKEPKVPGKAPMKTKQADLVESVLRDKDDYYAKRKALQDIQMDPNTHKDPELSKEVIRRKHALEREAKKLGVVSENIVRAFVELGEDNFGTSVKRPSRPGSRPPRGRAPVKEAPIEMDPQNPNDPMVMPPGLNPGKLSYRKSRAAAQLQDLARMAAQANEKDSPAMWDSIVKHFPELETNIRSIQHGMQELEARRRKGGSASKGITKV